jgi:hypothetical protein
MTAKKLVRRDLRSAVAGLLCTSMLLCTQGVSADELHGSETGTIREAREFLIKMPNELKARKMGVEVVDGVVVLEGDIVLGSLSKFEGKQVAGTISLDQEATTSAVAIDGANRRWTGSIIRYVLPTNHPQLADIQAGIRIVQQTTNLCMLPRTTQVDFVQFVSGSGCSSSVGKVGGRQNITIGGCSRGSVVHEVFHAAGLFHAQSREDRDRFVTVNFANIQAGRANNFQKSVNGASDIGTYDYGSIMHYSRLAFSGNGLPTITVLPPANANTIIGQRNAPSTRDVAAINTLYPTRNTSAACVQARQ